MYYIKIAGECMLKMDLEYEKETFYIRLAGSLTRKESYKINNYVIPVLKKHQIKKVIIDLTNLNTLDESGINAILNIKCTVRNNKGVIYLSGLSKEIELKLKHLHIKTNLREKEREDKNNF